MTKKLQDHPNNASFILTEACNLRCTYCFEGGKHPNKHMSFEVAEAGVEYLIENAKIAKQDSINITFFGGEPALNVPTMEHTFDYAVKRCEEENLRFGCMIITNGTVFTEDYRLFLIKWWNTLKDIQIQISYDGVPEVNDQFRITADGKGSSALIEATLVKYLDLFKEQEIPLTPFSLSIHGVVNKPALPRLFESYMHMRNLGIDSIWFMPLHEDEWEDSDEEIFREQLTLIADKVYDDCVENDTSRYYTGYASLANCKGTKPDAPCGAGKNYCSIASDGRLYPCHQFFFIDSDEFDYGNVLEGGEVDGKRDLFLQYDKTNMFGDMNCAECNNTECYTCIATNYAANDNMFVGFPAYCKLSRVEREIRYSLRDRMAEAGLINNSKSGTCGVDGCSCGDKDNAKVEIDFKEIAKYTLETITPVMEALGTSLESIGEHVNRIDVLENKIDSIFGILELIALSINKESEEEV